MERAETVEKAGFCCLCRSRCGAVFEVSGDRLIKAKPAPDHPTGKALCVKGKAAPEIAHSPERMLHPMRRTTPKTDPDPGWERVSWEEAMRDIAARLGAIREASGAEAVGFGVTTPSGTPISDSIEWVERFIRLFGSPNSVYGTEICNWHKDHAHRFTYGSGILYPDHANADAILLWGFNPSAVWLDQATQIAAARGARIIAVDPRRTGYARRADPWLRVRPGTDGALAMGLAHILIEREALRRRLHPALEQWAAPRANGYRPIPARGGGDGTGRCDPSGRAARGWRPRLLRSRNPLLRRGPRHGYGRARPAGYRADRPRRFRAGRVPSGLRSLCRGLRRIRARRGGGADLRAGGRPDGGGGDDDRRAARRLLLLVRGGPASRRDPDGSGDRAADGPQGRL